MYHIKKRFKARCRWFISYIVLYFILCHDKPLL